MNDLMGHIIRPYEDENLTISDLINILNLEIELPKEKFDGQNICFKITPQGILYARSPSHINNAFGIDKFINQMKYKNFIDSINRLNADLEKFKNKITYDQSSLFNNGYMSVELIDNKNSNLLLYDQNYIIIHGIINSNDLTINYNLSNFFEDEIKLSYFTLRKNNILDLSKFKQNIMSNGLSSEMELFNIPLSTPIKQLDEFIKSSIISEFVRQEVKLLKNISFKHNISMENQVKIQNLKKNKPIYIQNDEQINKLYKNLDFNNASLIEGIVFFYKQKLYKLTGIYSTLNRINYKTRSL